MALKCGFTSVLRLGDDGGVFVRIRDLSLGGKIGDCCGLIFGRFGINWIIFILRDSTNMEYTTGYEIPKSFYTFQYQGKRIRDFKKYIYI